MAQLVLFRKLSLSNFDKEYSFGFYGILFINWCLSCSMKIVWDYFNNWITFVWYEPVGSFYFAVNCWGFKTFRICVCILAYWRSLAWCLYLCCILLHYYQLFSVSCYLVSSRLHYFQTIIDISSSACFSDKT